MSAAADAFSRPTDADPALESVWRSRPIACSSSETVARADDRILNVTSEGDQPAETERDRFETNGE